MTRAEALKKLLALGDLTLPEIRVTMGGDLPALDAAMGRLQDAGELTWRNAGSGQRLWMLARQPDYLRRAPG